VKLLAVRASGLSPLLVDQGEGGMILAQFARGALGGGSAVGGHPLTLASPARLIDHSYYSSPALSKIIFDTMPRR